MPAPYNPSWSQPFTQQPPQMKEFDFDAHSGDLHSQNTYTFQQPQVQMPSGSGSTPAGLRANFNPSQQQQRQQARSGSYGDNTLPSGAFHHGYDPSTNQSQGLESFNPMYSSPSQDQVGWNESTPYTFAKPISTNNDFDGQGFGLSTSPSAIQDTFPPTSQQQLPYSSSLSTPDPRMKRPRSIDDDLEADTSDAKEASKLKGACSRCKNLKVKCEFKTETDPCKRCLNGGHECVIPGRKKRRTPPKREHLMNQIREQAAQIKDLMAQLESSENSPHRRGSSAVSDLASSSALQSPLLSPTSTHSSHAPHETSTVSPETNKAVEDWVAKAKQSFEEFDVFIGIGGPGMPKGYLVEDDLEKADSEEDDYVNISDHESDFEFAVEHHDGDEIHGNGTLKHHSSSSSLGTNGTGLPRKKHSGESAKPVILPGAEVPIGLLARMSLQASSKKRGTSAEPAEEEEDKTPGIANTNFFRSTSTPQVMNKKLSSSIVLPLILARGLITPVEAEQLFKIYFDRMNLSVSLLDPVLYTAQRTIIRSPFLFTVICAIASRFYAQRPSLYAQAMLYAQQAAGTALITGQKNVEMCSAYILLSLYPVPAKRWEDQRSWLYLGLAIRTATDLNLHLPNTAKPQNENHARELLNRTRVWLNCFNLDRSTGSQHGKPPIINPADYMANHSEDWWKSSPHNMKNFDIHICAYNAELKVMANFIRQIYSDPHHPTGLNKNVDFEKIATETDDAIKQLGAKWSAILEQGAPDLTDPQNSFRSGLLQLAYPYGRLVALSYGFQHAFGKNNTDENPFLKRCLDAAFDVVNPVLNDLCRPSQRIFFRHGPEAQSVFLTFASAFLVKLLQPKFASYLTIQKRLEIRETVQKVVDLLSSPEIAIDDRNGPGLYAKFIKSLLAAPMAQVDPTSPPPPRRVRVSPTTVSQPVEPPVAPSRSTSVSLSPVPRQEALSFETFAPVGAMDPFAHSGSAMTNSLALNLGSEEGPTLPPDFFQPPLPFDDAIMHSMQSLSDPNTWHDITLPSNFNWNTFQQNIDMDFRVQEPVLYSDAQQPQYMTSFN